MKHSCLVLAFVGFLVFCQGAKGQLPDQQRALRGIDA